MERLRMQLCSSIRSFTLLLLSGLWISSAFGAPSSCSSAHPFYLVMGVKGGSASFPVKLTPARSVEKIEWEFLRPKTGTPFRLAESRGGKLKQPEPIDFSKELEEIINHIRLIANGNHSDGARHFRKAEDLEWRIEANARYLSGNRLEMADKDTLTMRSLKVDDIGEYRARVWLEEGQPQDSYFCLNLLESVPAPQIHHGEVSQTLEGCNVTLQCQVSQNGKYNLTWGKGFPPRDFVRGVDEYQLSDNGRNLSVSWQKGSPDSIFTCLVSNPADLKKTSADLSKICLTDDNDPGRRLWQVSWWLVVPLLAIAVCALVIFVMKQRKRGSKKENRGITSTMRGGEENFYVPQDQANSSSNYELVQVCLGAEGSTVPSTPPAVYETIEFHLPAMPDQGPHADSSDNEYCDAETGDPGKEANPLESALRSPPKDSNGDGGLLAPKHS